MSDNTIPAPTLWDYIKSAVTDACEDLNMGDDRIDCSLEGARLTILKHLAKVDLGREEDEMKPDGHYWDPKSPEYKEMLSASRTSASGTPPGSPGDSAPA